MTFKKYLLDESLLVYLDRDDYEYSSQLVAFLEAGRLTNKDKKYDFFMPYSAKLRIGAFRIFKAKTLFSKIATKIKEVREPLEKAKNRANMAKLYVKKYKKLPLRYHFFQSQIINYFIFANAKKTNEYQKNNKRKIFPNEIISLDTCKAALIAKSYNLPIVSFNKDFKYLTMIPGKFKINLQYFHPDDILKDYSILE